MPRLSLLEWILGAALIAATAFGGWNWWRKTVYYNQLHTLNATRQEDARKATENMQLAANLAATKTAEKQRARREALQAQLDAIGDTPPDVRIEYRVRDRWLTGTCPAGADGSLASVPGAGGGLHTELERYVLRGFSAADDVVDERNLCVDLYNRARAAALEWNRKHGR